METQNCSSGGGSSEPHAEKRKTNISREKLESVFKMFKKLLSLDSPTCYEREKEDEDDQSRGREGLLKITLHILRSMKQTGLANTLQSKLDPACHQKLKSKLKNKCKNINEGISEHGRSALLNEIYTELYITEGGSGEVNNEHEVRQIETASRRTATQKILFLHFLLGLSLDSSQSVLRDLYTHTESISHSNEEAVKYIKEKIRENPSPEKSINLFHCLNELNDHSLVQEVQTYLSRGGGQRLHKAKLSPAQWSALVFVLLNSEEELDVFDLSKYDPSEECLLRLLPVVKASRMAVLKGTGSIRLNGGVRKYFCHLTLNPNTAQHNLILSENNRVVRRSVTEQRYSDHPERFNWYQQVMCEESVCGHCYWEVEWSSISEGWVSISVSYKEISRKGAGNESRFGLNNQSWSLECSSSLSFWHNKIKTKISESPSSRIGVYVDHSAGTLSFYRVSDTMTLLHRVHTAFTQPLYAGFRVHGYGTTVRLCDPE